MCKGSNDPGGAHRCSSHARNKLEAARADVDAAGRDVDDLAAELADIDRTYSTDTAFRAALNARIRATATATGIAQQDLARRFALQQFVMRLSADDPTMWTVLGGTALQYRTQQARPTRDADLAARDDITDLQGTLERASRRRPGEYGDFTIKVNPKKAHESNYQCTITYSIGGSRMSVAGVDITTTRALPDAVDVVTPEAVINIDDSAPTTAVRVYPVADHIADKIGAMYQTYGSTNTEPSTRPHDLADLVIISRNCPVDADELKSAIKREQRRRNAAIPNPLTLPNPQWRDTYADKASGPNVPRDAATLDDALSAAETFLRPLLEGKADGARWNPDTHRWERSGN